ncbi:hypothetical protein DRI50_01255 [candidate division KSB1 bacterium]|nr:MAG: hypothetical protein DRI50_01255 [candidate division KSB1 bacterium]
MKIAEESIRRSVPDIIFRRGKMYAHSDRVKILRKGANFDVEAEVLGTRKYFVRLFMNKFNTLTASCTCPYFEEYGLCKHIVATILVANEYDEEIDFKKNSWKSILDYIEKEKQYSQKSSKKLAFTLEFDDDSWSITPTAFYIKKDGSLGRKMALNSNELRSGAVIALSDELVAAKALLNNKDISYYYFSYQNRFSPGENIGHIISLLTHSIIFSEREEKITFYPNPLSAQFVLSERKDEFHLSFQLKDEQKNKVFTLTKKFYLLTTAPVYLYSNKIIYPVKESIPKSLILPFTSAKGSLIVPKSELEKFFKTVYAQIVSAGVPIQLPENFRQDIFNHLVKKAIYLSEQDEILQIDVKFFYGSQNDSTQIYEVNGLRPRSSEIIYSKNKIYLIARQKKLEEALINFLLENRLKMNETDDVLVLKSRTNPFDWLFDNLPKIAEHGFEIYGEDQLTKLKVRRSTPKIISKVSSESDWFDLNIDIDFDGLRVSYFELAKSIKKGKKFIQLHDGSAVRLDKEVLDKLGLISHFAQKVSGKNTLRMSKTQALLVNEIIKSSKKASTDKAFKKQLKKFEAFHKIKSVPIPKHFTGKLRPYQKAGLDWLCFLNEFGFGGCLADDMGLGKTVQALSLLQREKERSNKKLLNLIVAPTSVLPNWELEAKRFTPQLKVLIHYGNDRTKSATDFEPYDIVVTSYALLRRDYSLFKEISFHYIILDESQKIKNPHSQTAQVARMLKGKHRLVMTGTPIENNLSELWSQFQFLNPGMLGSLKSFTAYYGNAIEKHGDQEKAEQLRRLIYPFILRRTKETVAKELPPKTETIIFCEMDKHQASVYRKWRDYYRALILNQIEDQGINRSRMKVLEGLTKLRQISIHPLMVEKEYKNSSGKFETLWNILEDLFSENHKVLVFSQFVKALTLVRQQLDSQKIKYAYLDGSSKKRQEIIDQFQNNEDQKIFLISLKAGGLGLNLTSADYVIHLDPWWNPAVENQATDRAYRIGQTQNVFVYKMITKDSVEEKILALQEKKKKLADTFISTESAFFKNLDKKDIEVLFS